MSCIEEALQFIYANGILSSKRTNGWENFFVAEKYYERRRFLEVFFIF